MTAIDRDQALAALDPAIEYLTGEYGEDFPMVERLVKLRAALPAIPLDRERIIEAIKYEPLADGVVYPAENRVVRLGDVIAKIRALPVLETPPPQKFQECDEDGLPTIEAICAALNRHADYMEAGNNAELAEVYDAAQQMIFRGAPVEPVPAPRDGLNHLDISLTNAQLQQLMDVTPVGADEAPDFWRDKLLSAPVPAPRLECPTNHGRAPKDYR